MTAYVENGNTYVESWFQIGNVRFSKKKCTLKFFDENENKLTCAKCEEQKGDKR
jgi:hypothetical protein